MRFTLISHTWGDRKLTGPFMRSVSS